MSVKSVTEELKKKIAPFASSIRGKLTFLFGLIILGNLISFILLIVQPFGANASQFSTYFEGFLLKSLIFFSLSLLFSFLFAHLVSIKIIESLKQLTVASQKIGRGDFTSPIDVSSTDEIGTLAKAIQTLNQGVSRLIVETSEKARMKTELVTARAIQEMLFPENPIIDATGKVKLVGKHRSGVLASAFQKMAREMQRLLSETAEKARMLGELATARAVQETLFPENSALEYGGLRVVGKYRSMTECGGDWWWHWKTKDKVFVFIVDATGHGVSAALVTSAARSAIATLEYFQMLDLEKIVHTLSNCIALSSRGRHTMSGFFVEIEIKTKLLKYYNASHIPAVILPANPTAQLNWQSMNFLDAPISPVIGNTTKEMFICGQYQLKEGERVVLLTDGVIERKNSEGQMLSERRFFSSILDLYLKNPVSIEPFIEGLFQISDTHAGAAMQDDDLTAVVIDV